MSNDKPNPEHGPVHALVGCDLLPCPFCGSDRLHKYHGHGGLKVQCFGCWAQGITIKIWNRRASNASDHRPATVDSNLKQAPGGGSGASA